jgi:3-deoxy-D-manno-octulosonate 8-phosphate phosphatase (KDO 8-P phosphatase)
MSNYREKLKEITTFIFDFDGVLSDGKVYVLPDGDQLRATDVKDGYAIHYALKQGYNIAVISGGYSETMRLRYKSFPDMEIYLKIGNKVEKLEEYMKDHQLTTGEILYIGDDIPDWEIMQRCGLKCCPADAVEEIKAISDYISFQPGGRGCVRDLIEQVMKAQGKWFGEGACIW